MKAGRSLFPECSYIKWHLPPPPPDPRSPGFELGMALQLRNVVARYEAAMTNAKIAYSHRL